MKIGWQLTKLLQKLSGLLFFGPPCIHACSCICFAVFAVNLFTCKFTQNKFTQTYSYILKIGQYLT